MLYQVAVDGAGAWPATLGPLIGTQIAIERGSGVDVDPPQLVASSDPPTTARGAARRANGFPAGLLLATSVQLLHKARRVVVTDSARGFCSTSTRRGQQRSRAAPNPPADAATCSLAMRSAGRRGRHVHPTNPSVLSNPPPLPGRHTVRGPLAQAWCKAADSFISVSCPRHSL